MLRFWLGMLKCYGVHNITESDKKESQIVALRLVIMDETAFSSTKHQGHYTCSADICLL